MSVVQMQFLAGKVRGAYHKCDLINIPTHRRLYIGYIKSENRSTKLWMNSRGDYGCVFLCLG